MSGSDNPFDRCDDVIKRNILRYLDLQSVKQCRHIDKLWMKVAADFISRNSPSLYFQYTYGLRCYEDKYIRTLSDLIASARGSEQFPCTSFTFRGGDMTSEDASEFFDVMGDSVKTLTLIAVDNVSFTNNMNLTTILNQTPNLETLILNGHNYYDTDATDQLVLPELKCIQIASRFNATLTPGIEQLLSGAPNLQRIDGVWRLEDLAPIVTTRKIHTIKRWCPTSHPFPSGLIQLENATENGLKLNALRLNELVVFIEQNNVDRNGVVDAGTLWTCYNNLLLKNSIQKLILTCSMFQANQLFPLNMNNVKELVLLGSRDPQTLRHFPLYTNLCTTFPRLHTLSFHGLGNWRNCFPLSHEFQRSNQIFSTVTTLKLGGKSTFIEMLLKMKKMCPSVQSLEIHLYGALDKTQIGREIFGIWQHLKKLSINLDQCELKSQDNLDGLFTGLNPNTFETLNFELTDEQKLVEAENTRDVLWIGSIAGLIQLDVEYEIRHGHIPDQWNNKILIPFTRFSGQYAFNVMPKLRVRLHYLHCSCCTNIIELQNDLHSISPFATIIRR